MRRIALICISLLGLGALLATGAPADDASRTYKIEMYNAFGVVDGSEVRVSGVNVGTVSDLTVNELKRAVVTVEISGDLAELGDETTCASEPQSLIAEYFIDCAPAGAPLEDGGTIPASRVSQTVQADLVQNTLRDPFRDRLRLLINEFGTALAGNSGALNEAIRLGAPALTELQDATGTLAGQRNLIRELTSDSETILGELSAQREQITDFVDKAEDTARISVERREDLGTDFALLDDFLAEFEPTLVELDRFAREQTPLLVDLKAAAPELYRLSVNLPPFNRATDDSLRSLGNAADVGNRALTNGEDEIRLLAEAGRKAPVTTEVLADFLSDLDDPRRAVEIDDRVEPVTGRTAPEAGTRNTMGYTGLEGLLNYVRNQTLTINQFDKVSHLFRFGIYDVFSGPCGSFSSGYDPATGDPGVPADGGGTTTDILEAADCVAWLGKNQPGISEDLGLGKYNPAVCPLGTAPERARIELCDPNDPAARSRSERSRNPNGAGGSASGPRDRSGPASPGAGLPPDPGGGVPGLDDLLDLPNDPLKNGLGRGGQGGGRDGDAGQATEDLLDFLFAP